MTAHPQPQTPSQASPQEQGRIVTASLIVQAPAEQVFELIADPAQQPLWDGNGNLSSAESGQRVRGVGDVFVMTNSNGKIRDNRVTEFEEGRLIAWKPTGHGQQSLPGHLWRWELAPQGEAVLLTHTYDYTQLNPSETQRLAKAQKTTEQNLMASLQRLKSLAEGSAPGQG